MSKKQRRPRKGEGASGRAEGAGWGRLSGAWLSIHGKTLREAWLSIGARRAGFSPLTHSLTKKKEGEKKKLFPLASLRYVHCLAPPAPRNLSALDLDFPLFRAPFSFDTLGCFPPLSIFGAPLSGRPPPPPLLLLLPPAVKCQFPVCTMVPG